jgi:hypothetical protein
MAPGICFGRRRRPALHRRSAVFPVASGKAGSDRAPQAVCRRRTEHVGSGSTKPKNSHRCGNSATIRQVVEQHLGHDTLYPQEPTSPDKPAGPTFGLGQA